MDNKKYNYLAIFLAVIGITLAFLSCSVPDQIMQVTATFDTTQEAVSFVEPESGQTSELAFESQAAGLTLYPNSPLRRLIPANAVYVRETRIGSMRQGEQQWQLPIYRPSTCASTPLVSVDNRYSNRVEMWPISTAFRPATAADAHMFVLCPDMGFGYEMWEASWASSTLINAGGMVNYALDGNGITPLAHRRTTAAGIAMSNGNITLEDFSNGATSINHALNISLPARILSTGFISPAVGGEEAGSGGSTGIPMGAIFAIPRNVDVDAIPNLHPFTRLILHAAQDYGMYVTDGNGSAANPDGTGNANVRVETGLLQQVYGVSNDSLMSRIQSETRGVISQYGIFRVTFTGGTNPTPSPTATVRTVTPTTTRTPVATNTPTTTSVVTPTATRTTTNTPQVTSTPTPRILTCRLFWDFRLNCP